MKKILLIGAALSALSAHANIPQLKDTQCRLMRANGQPEKERVLAAGGWDVLVGAADFPMAQDKIG